MTNKNQDESLVETAPKRQWRAPHVITSVIKDDTSKISYIHETHGSGTTQAS